MNKMFLWCVISIFPALLFAQNIRIPAEVSPICEYTPFGEGADKEKIPFGDQGDFGKTFIAVENPILYSDSKASSPALEKRLAFRQIVYAYAQEGEFFLISSSKEPSQWLGWIHKDELQLGSEALKVKNLENGDIQFIDRQYGLSGKVFTVPGVVKPKKSPQEKAEGLHSLRIYTWLFICKVKKNLNGDEWLLLANRNMIPQYDSETIEKIILGWVPQNRLFFWNTSYALQENLTNRKERFAVDYQEPGLVKKGALISVYRNLESLEAFVTYLENPNKLNEEAFIKSLGERGSLRITENTNSLPKQYYENRYPWISIGKLRNKYEYYRLALIGDCITRDGKRIPSRYMDTVRYLITKLHEQAKIFEIVFVLDDTGSMSQYFKDASTAILAIKGKIDELSRKEQIKVRYKLVKYRDFYEKSDESSFIVQSTGTECQDGDTIKNLTDALAEPCLQPKTTYTAIFYAIQKSLEGGVFQENSWRIMILLGDHGNHIPDGMDHPKASADEGKDKGPADLTVQKIAQLLKENDVYFHAIQVEKTEDKGTPADVFKDQMCRIIELCGESRPENTDRLYSYTCETQNVADSIVKKVMASLEEKRKYQKMLQDFMDTGTMNFPLELQAYLDRLINENRKIENLQAFGSHGWFVDKMLGHQIPPWALNIQMQLLEEGYAFASYPFPQSPATYPLFEKVVLVNFEELASMHAFIAHIVKNAKPKALKNAFKVCVEIYFREEEIEESKSVAYYLAKLASFPPQSPLLNIPIKCLDQGDTPLKLISYFNTMEKILKARLSRVKYKVTSTKKYEITDFSTGHRVTFEAPKNVTITQEPENLWWPRQISNKDLDPSDLWAWIPVTDLP